VSKILIVDDQYTAARLLVSLLELDGYRAQPVTDWQNLVNEIEEHAPDLVILDVHLPEADGFELLGQVRAHPDSAVADVPVLIISALDYGHRCGTANANGFLLKPFTRKELLEAVRKVEHRGMAKGMVS
jgi:CheY-like chemotaxis protein